MDIKRVIELIEKLRTELNELHESKELIDEEVIKKSQELDRLLNEYERLLEK